MYSLDILAEKGQLLIRFPAFLKIVAERIQWIPGMRFDEGAGAWVCPDDDFTKQWIRDFFPFAQSEVLHVVKYNRKSNKETENHSKINQFWALSFLYRLLSFWARSRQNLTFPPDQAKRNEFKAFLKISRSGQASQASQAGLSRPLSFFI